MTFAIDIFQRPSSASYNSFAFNTNGGSFISFWNKFQNFPCMIDVSCFYTRFLVPILFFKSCPSTICRFVSFRIINPINRFIRRSFSHIFKKIKEIISPSLANCNSFCTIPFVTSIIRILASSNHISPTSICIRISHSMARYLTSFTSFRRTISKCFSKNFFDKATRTLTFPHNMTIRRIRSFFKNSPSSKRFIGKVYEFHEQYINKTSNYGEYISHVILQGG